MCFHPCPGTRPSYNTILKQSLGKWRTAVLIVYLNTKKVIQDELKAMLDLGVLEELNSDWASPIVLVLKTDGWVKVNAMSKFDAYPMSWIDELLDRIGSPRFYSTLDLTKGQIPLSPLSKEKTAFTTPYGLHQFVTLPFRLFGAPATFHVSWTRSSGHIARTPL